MYVESSGRWHEQRSSDVKWSRSDGQTLCPLTTGVRFNAAKTFQTLDFPYLWSQAATPLPVPFRPPSWSPPVSHGWKDAVWKVKFKSGRKRASSGQWTADFFLLRRKRVVPWPNLCLPVLPSRSVGHVGRSCRNLPAFMWMRAVISRTTWKKNIIDQSSSVIGIFTFYVLCINSFTQPNVMCLVLWIDLYFCKPFFPLM